METTQSIVQELDEMVRAHFRGEAVVSDEYVERALRRILSSDACTALDALAILNFAQRLLNASGGVVTNECFVKGVQLIAKASEALEHVTGTSAASFEPITRQ